MSKDLARELFISPSEISVSLERSAIAGLIDKRKVNVNKQTFMDFIEYGLAVVFPALPGRIVNGLFTAHAHPYIAKHFHSEELFVWPDARGEGRGQSIEPLYKTAVQASLFDSDLYEVLALVDVIRVSKVREKKFALNRLKEIFYESFD